METAITVEELKELVRQKITTNIHNIVTNKTKKNVSGIYMLYIDNFISDKIVPIYIGQAKDIQRRYKQHYTELLSLNRLNYEEYYKYFFNGSYSFYEGHFKTSKIFKYMVDNACELKDFQMIILDEVDENQLDEKEQEYINTLLSSFFGFNQLNSFVIGLKYRYASEITNIELDGYLDILMNDIRCIYKYYEFGFTRFNFEHAFSKEIEYLKKNPSINIHVLQKFDEAKHNLRELIKSFGDTYTSSREERYKLIFPSIKFNSFPLKDRVHSNQLLMDDQSINRCSVYFFISNNGINRSIADYDKVPYIISVRYTYVDNQGRNIEKLIYVDNETTNYCKNGIKYIEKDFYDLWSIKKTPFNITSIINNEHNQSCISILSEYKHGINDYTLRDIILIDLTKIIDEIKEITNSETEFNIAYSESFECFKKCLLNEKVVEDEFVKQILFTKKSSKAKKNSNLTQKETKIKQKKLSIENSIKNRAEAYKNKIRVKSNNTIEVIEYLSSREKVTASCNYCKHQWKIRGDHLISRSYCPKCKKLNKSKI